MSLAMKALGPGARLLLVVFCAAVALATGVACDSRLREARSELSGDALAVFDRGAALSTPCWACHDFYGTQNRVGPYLSGVVGRRAGDTTFGGYSDALLGSGIVWDARTLERFLANPSGYVPGTTMVSPGVANAADRRALVFYMEKITSP